MLEDAEQGEPPVEVRLQVARQDPPEIVGAETFVRAGQTGQKKADPGVECYKTFYGCKLRIS